MASKAEIKKLTDLLDGYIEKAMTWPKRDETNPWADLSEEMEDKVAKTAATAAGRGVAEALVVCGQGGEANDVIRAAVARFRNGGVDPAPEPVAEVAPEPVAGAAPEPVASPDTVAYNAANGLPEGHPAPESEPTPVAVEPVAEPEPVAVEPVKPVSQESYDSWVNTGMTGQAAEHHAAGGALCSSCGGRGRSWNGPSDPSSVGTSGKCESCNGTGFDGEFAGAKVETQPGFVELAPDHEANIRAALEAQFSPELVAAQFKIPVEQVRQYLPGA